MSNLDKHKPLSAEELFKLLEKKPNNSTDFEDMDGFEKEALEGFAAYSTPQTARTLTNELNQAISKKASDSEGKGSQKNKIIWFSAAASIVLIIIVSIFFFNQTKQNSENNIALNESKEDEKTLPQLEPAKPLEIVSDNTVLNEIDKAPRQKKSQEIVATKNAESESAAGLVMQAPITLAENKPAFGSEKVAKDESKNRAESDKDDLQKPSVILTDKIDVKKKEKGNIEQEQLANGYAATQNITTTTATNEEVDKLTSKSDGDSDSRNTKKLEKASKEKSASDKSVANSVGFAKTTPAPSSGSTSRALNNAYYPGSELAIREFVLNYLKEKQSLVSIAGTYKITGIVSDNGKLKVISIIQTTKVNCNCENTLTEALNTMTKWNPAIERGENISSNVEFTIAF